MTQFSLNAAPESGSILLCGLTPSGRIDVYQDSPDEGPRSLSSVEQRVLRAFATGRGTGVLHLGATELSTELHPTLSYWRDIGRSFVSKACGVLDPTDSKSLVIPDPDPHEISALVHADSRYKLELPPKNRKVRITVI